jgi:hypothetical protein
VAASSVKQGLFWTTGGGFSNISARAPYQAQEVERYLNHKSITFPASGKNAHQTTRHTTHDTTHGTTTTEYYFILICVCVCVCVRVLSGVWIPNGRAYPDVSAVGHSTPLAIFFSIFISVN